MPAYVVAQVNVTDDEKFEEYRKRVPDSIAKFGGKYLARGGELLHLEGESTVPRLVVLEFSSLETARAWYESPEYQHAKQAREGGAQMQMVAVEGV